MPRAAWMGSNYEGRWFSFINGQTMNIVRVNENSFQVLMGDTLLTTRATFDRARNSASWYANNPQTLPARTRRILSIAEVLSSNANTDSIFSTRSFGVEIEIQSCSFNKREIARLISEAGIPCHEESYNHNTRNNWKIITDATVGWGEIVSPVLTGLRGIEQIKKICSILVEKGARVNRSCGIHVHVGINTITVDQLKRMVKNWQNIQPGCEWLVPASRRLSNNTYCRSNRVVDENRIDECATVGQIDGAFCGYNRYYKMSLSPFSRQGTVEFRQHAGSTDGTKITSWIKFLLSFVDGSIEGKEYTKMRPYLIHTTEEFGNMICEVIGHDEATSHYLMARGMEFINAPAR